MPRGGLQFLLLYSSPSHLHRVRLWHVFLSILTIVFNFNQLVAVDVCDSDLSILTIVFWRGSLSVGVEAAPCFQFLLLYSGSLSALWSSPLRALSILTIVFACGLLFQQCRPCSPTFNSYYCIQDRVSRDVRSRKGLSILTIVFCASAHWGLRGDIVDFQFLLLYSIRVLYTILVVCVVDGSLVLSILTIVFKENADHEH